MNIYFSATITDDEASRSRYKKIIEYLKGQGHKVLEYEQDKLSPRELLNRSDAEIKKSYKRLTHLLKSADVYIADITIQSVGIGYEIADAISERKPVLVLSHKDREFTPLATIEGNQSKMIDYQEYTEDTIEEILEYFIKKASGKLDTKFILIISPEIDRYLRWASDEKRMHKAQIVREAVEAMIKKDKAYKEYQKSINE